MAKILIILSKIILLGAGRVGKTIAIDLAEKHDVTAIDINRESLKHFISKGIKTILMDLSDSKALKKLVGNYDLVVSAVPGFIGFQTFKAVIEAGINIVDISFFREYRNALELNDFAKRKNVIAIFDCGLAPGMDNLILGRWIQQMKIESFECLVGGLPKVKEGPFNYKAPFSPVDVIEEYTRDVLYIKNGRLTKTMSMTDIEYIDFDGIGTLEAFNTDGLRSLLTTMKNINNMKEKTLRYPGHAKLILALRESGFFSKKPFFNIIPFEFTSALLFKQWKLEHGEEEFTVMRIIIQGFLNKKRSKITYSLYDEYDKATGATSMSRTTGYAATAVSNLVLDGIYNRKGVSPPEYIGKDEKCFNYIMKYLEDRDLHYIIS